MRGYDVFQSEDLDLLEGLLSRASDVVPMEDVFDGYASADAIGMRHDCDNVIEQAVQMACWEGLRGYRSTYYILHTAPYWQDKTQLRSALESIDGSGHEIGIHNDAITVQLETGKPAHVALAEAVDELRGYGFRVRSTVAHGNRRCRVDGYVNDEMFKECKRPAFGDIARLGVETYPLASFGLEFDANWLTRKTYISDSGGRWSHPWSGDLDLGGRLHMLIHPDWWGAALKQAAA